MALDYVYWFKFFTALVYSCLSAYLVKIYGFPLLTYLLIVSAAVIYVLLAEALWRVGGMRVSRRSSYLNGVGGYAGAYLIGFIIFFNVLA